MNRVAYPAAAFLLLLSAFFPAWGQDTSEQPAEAIVQPAQSAATPTVAVDQRQLPPAKLLSQPSEAAAPAPVQASAPSTINSAEGDYVLQPGDSIEMTIFREPDLTSRSSIARDGTVQFPLIQEVKIAGLTVRAARDLLRNLYNDHYLVSPQVYLNVVEFAQRKFTILGQILKPGSYELEGAESMSLLEAIGMAGGFTRIANEGKILIKRKVAGKNLSLKANAKRMAAGKDDPLVILPGDVITVGESWY